MAEIGLINCLPTERRPRLEFYATKGRHRWRLRAANGRILARCAQARGFASHGGALRNWNTTRKAITGFDYEIKVLSR